MFEKIKTFIKNKKYMRRVSVVVILIIVFTVGILNTDISSKEDFEKNVTDKSNSPTKTSAIYDEQVKNDSVDEYAVVVQQGEDAEAKSDVQSGSEIVQDTVNADDQKSGNDSESKTSEKSSEKNKDKSANKKSNGINDNKASDNSDSKTVQSDSESTTATQDETIRVTLEIRCDAISGNNSLTDAGHPELETYAARPQILNVPLDLSKGATVYDATVAACVANNIQYDITYSATYRTAYVRGINYLYEKMAGLYSGWTYTVNGAFANRGCSAYTLNDGDTVVWNYVK